LKKKYSLVGLFLVSSLLLSTTYLAASTSHHSELTRLSISPISKSTTAQYEISETLVISNNADFALLGASGVGTSSDPYTFENLYISSNDTCILIQDTTAYFVISNCRFESDAAYGSVWFSNVENGKIAMCEFGLESIAGWSDIATGVYLSAVRDCSVEESLFYNCWNGVRLWDTSNCTVTRNQIHSNHKGVLLEHAVHCDVLNNSIYSNSDYGVYIDLLSHNNSIYGNSIGWNGGIINQKNAINMGGNNTFDDGISIGNLWSDYNESVSYVIPGGGNSTDEYAQLLEDNVNPTISPPEDLVVDVDAVGNVLTWQASDRFPVRYTIEQDMLEVVSATWGGDAISFNLDDLHQGTHTILLMVFDGEGNSAADAVLITAVSFILGGIGTELVMIASAITLSIFIVVTVLIKKLS